MARERERERERERVSERERERKRSGHFGSRSRPKAMGAPSRQVIEAIIVYGGHNKLLRVTRPRELRRFDLAPQLRRAAFYTLDTPEPPAAPSPNYQIAGRYHTLGVVTWATTPRMTSLQVACSLYPSSHASRGSRMGMRGRRRRRPGRNDPC